MIFDQFLKLVELYIPQYKYIAEQARLFVFDIIPHESLPTNVPNWFDNSLFILPFPVTAVEDKASLMIVIDQKPNAIGLSIERRVIEVLYNGTDINAFSVDDEYKQQ